MTRHTSAVGVRKAAGLVALLSLSLGLAVTPVAARPDSPANLGNGLARLLRRMDPATGQVNRTRPAGQFVEDLSSLAAFNARGDVRVTVLLNGRRNLSDLKRDLQQRSEFKNVRILAESSRYRKGVFEAYVPPKAIAQLAKLPGVSAVHLSPKPVAEVGATTSQGVVQHRVDQVSPAGIDGSGITVGVLSDSYDTSTNTIKAANDIASGDLPGPGNPLGNTEPVIVLEDFPGGIDEGRAMLQIIHDLAPKAKLCFATAFNGQVGFANNIRNLADPALGCNADVIVDDIIYFDEPFFTDGIVAQAADEVAAAGVPYFSSAGNRPSTQGYFSELRLVPNTPEALAGTNIKLTNVPPALYAGGFHDFNPDPSLTDIAQTVQISGSGTLVFQWDDPFDVTEPVVGDLILSTTGTIAAPNQLVNIPFTGTAGEQVRIFGDGDASNGNPLPDITLALLDPNGVQLAFIDTTTNPETLLAFLPTSGTYTVQVGGFQGATGDFKIDINKTTGTPRITSDFNVLFFDTNGNFLFAADDNNIVNNRPIEIQGVSGSGNLQIVIARANTPAATPQPASKLRYVWFSSGFPQEYFSYQYPVTYGHNSAAGSNGVAAYPFYPPFIPEGFTSPGPVTILFDKNNNRLPAPEIRLKPDMAAMDGANTTFFTSDTTADPDRFPNFFGTSAAAPHAAAIAALVLQKNGGPGSVTSDQMRKILQRSAFPHDLDPYFARATVVSNGTRLSLNVAGDPNSISQFDTRVFRLAVGGSGGISKIVFDGSTGNPTGAGSDPGVAFDERSGPGLPFTVGRTIGITAGEVTFTLGPTPPAPAAVGQSFTFTLDFAPGAFSAGDLLTFGLDRDEFVTAFTPPGVAGGNSADLFGQGVLIPSGTTAAGGVGVTVTFADGSTASGTFANAIGRGYSTLDGFGFINAEAAVNSPLP